MSKHSLKPYQPELQGHATYLCNVGCNHIQKQYELEVPSKSMVISFQTLINMCKWYGRPASLRPHCTLIT